ncbi:family 78 glycoside hydrolase catalytic domain [Maribellus sp. CM-23]|uniref:family 78 glycoside hydrolase catalytic domain n=1 Tax=Maribellus sp. CM-23 TaxID=2781026 RepID=UPI001F348C90|nr:family 78 glycoside hydrolase catalytic domain [Maribellus sp. CM-23]MCE4564684.1 family 78 glycoside hydrolase catalytic domain [Maribellus sp. CM-23]
MKFLVIVFFIASILCVNKGVAQKVNSLENACWIGDEKEEPKCDSLLYSDDPAPLFRNEFTVKNGIKTAKLLVTAAGYYQASLNGIDIMNGVYCDPAWTDFRKRIYYSEYDISKELQEGINCVGISLGNGFYNSLPMKFWGKYNLRDYLATGRPVLIAKIIVEYTSGEVEEFISDKRWKYNYGPVIRNNVYLGEVYDARKEICGWNRPGYDDSSWNSAVVKEGPGGILQKTFFPPIQLIGIKKPIKIIESSKNVFLVDMGENFTGTFKIRMHGEYGDSISFRFGERIYDDNTLNPMTAVAGQIKSKGIGGAGAPEVAYQGGMFVFGAQNNIEYSPIFSYRVFRYIEISGLKKAPLFEDISGLVLGTNVINGNYLTTSNNLINSIQEATVRTFLSNLMSVQSDCPGREKFGYGGDLMVTSEAFVCNFEMADFYRKVLYDWVDAWRDSVFIDAAPYVGLQYCGLNYEASFFELQNNLFIYYGDTAIIRDFYDFNLQWMEKASRIHANGIVDRGISDHESLVNVPIQLLGTCVYLKTAQTMKKFAAIMDDRENKKRFAKLENEIRNKLRHMYWDGGLKEDMIIRQSYEASMSYINTLPEEERVRAIEKLDDSNEKYNKQTFYTLLLECDIIPEEDKEQAVFELIKTIDDAPSKHLTTGIFGTKYILEVLSELGYADRVFDIINSTEFPGWGYMIKQGATTLWETWEESDDIYSNCHPMFGSVSAWFYRYLIGVRPDPDSPGFKKFVLNPLFPKDIHFVNCTYNSPFGEIVIGWKKDDRQSLSMEITVPKGTTATLRLREEYLKGMKVYQRTEGHMRKMQPERCSVNDIELPEGEFLIKITL